MNLQTDEIKQYYAARRGKLAEYMKNSGITAAVFEDTEGRRDPAVRYFTGHNGDALLVFFSDNKAVLIPWDENLAKNQAVADKIIPYSRYNRQNVRAVKELLAAAKVSGKMTVELPSVTPYPLFLQYVDALTGWNVRCRENSLHDYVAEMRQIKDEYEIACTKKAAGVGDRIIDMIEEQVKLGVIKNETDVALLIERECRNQGCERTGFDTLAAGPSRSFAIHCFPNYTSAEWPANGLSILDFGVVYNGYTSDTTLTIAKGELSPAQKKQLDLVQTAYTESLELYKKDVPIQAAAMKAAEIFAKAKRTMPHTLGHGIGLEIHEIPIIRVNTPAEKIFQPGMIVTLEPGLYDPEIGGSRLENDILITETGNEVISHSRIIYLTETSENPGF